MSNTLFIGKDLPDSLSFAEVLADSGRSVFGAVKSEADAANFESEKIFATTRHFLFQERVKAVSKYLPKTRIHLLHIPQTQITYKAKLFGLPV